MPKGQLAFKWSREVKVVKLARFRPGSNNAYRISEQVIRVMMYGLLQRPTLTMCSCILKLKA